MTKITAPCGKVLEDTLCDSATSQLRRHIVSCVDPRCRATAPKEQRPFNEYWEGFPELNY